jgi:8-oxo-dGTP pyrophosphatase MutT (NUDIX family)
LKFEIEKFRKNNSIKVIVFRSSDVEKLFSDFKSNFQYVEAAGGIVYNSKNKVLLIKRNGLWDLPKGKVEQGETYTEAALREVTEECGITNQTIDKELEATYHTFVMNNVNYLKKTHWFTMKYSGNETPKPQLEEGLTKVEWIEKSKTKYYFKNMFASIIDVLKSEINSIIN